MNTLKLPVRTIVYAAAAVLLLGVFIVQEAATTRRNTVEVPEIPDDVSRIVLSSGGETLTLARRDGSDGSEWTVGSQAYPADGEAVDALLDAVAAVTSADVITSREAYERYGLGQASRKSVTFYAGDREVLTLNLGSRASAGDSVYARIDDGRDVVLLPGALEAAFSTDPDEFRPREIVSIPEAEVETIRVTAAGMEPTVVERDVPEAAPEEGDGAEASVWIVSSGEEVEQVHAERVVSTLASLRADAFPDEEPPGEPFASIVVRHTSGEQTELSLWPPADDGRYPVRASTYPYPFMISDWIAKRLLLNVNAVFEAFEDDEE